MPNGEKQPVTLDLSRSQPLERTVESPAGEQVTTATTDTSRSPFPVTGFEDVSTEKASGVLGAVQEAGAGVAIGAGREALRTLTGIPEAVRPGSTGGFGAIARSEPEGLAEKVGGWIEQGVEFATGLEVLKAKKLVAIARAVPEALGLAEKFPRAARILLAAEQSGTVGAAQGAVKSTERGEILPNALAGAVGGAAGGVAGEALSVAAETKVARGFINRSLGATGRDLRYGDPARGLLDEDIITPMTGDATLNNPGGRLQAVRERLSELKAQLDQAVDAVKDHLISVKKTIVDPIYEKGKEIIENRAMTEAEKDAAWTKIADLQRALTDSLGDTMTPGKAIEIKRQLGDRINWGGTTSVTDEVKPLYRTLYGSLRDAAHQASSKIAELDARMTNLHAAYDALKDLALKEGAGGGRGVLAGNFWDIPQRILDELGRILPAVKVSTEVPGQPVRAAFGVAGERAAVSRAHEPSGETFSTLSPGFTRITASDGSVHDVPTEQLEKARAIDPGLQVHQEGEVAGASPRQT